MSYKYLLCDGGGFKVVSYLGILQYMWENNELDNIKTMCGVSGGSIIVGLLACGLTPREVKDFFVECHVDEDEFNLLEIYDMYGIYKNKKDSIRLENIIRKNTKIENTTIQNIYDMYGIKLYISIYNLSKKIHMYAPSHWTLFNAIKASCNVPFFNVKLQIYNEYYIDPCFTSSKTEIFNLFEKKEKKEILYFNVKLKENFTQLSNFYEYALSVLHSSMKMFQENYQNFTSISTKSDYISFIFVTESFEQKRFLLNKCFKENYYRYKKNL